MDYENFKESFTEALQEDLYGKGIEARFDMKSVEKLNNEGYDAVTVTPADSNIGVTLNVEAFYKAHESGASMDEVVSKASDTVIRGFDNQPSIDVASLMDYEALNVMAYSSYDSIIMTKEKMIRGLGSQKLPGLFCARNDENAVLA